MESIKIRTIIYGDIHGCLEELKLLRKKLNILKDDKEYCVGDLVDRGLYSKEILTYCYKHGIASVIGNHEYKYLRYKKHHDLYQKTGKKIPMELSEDKLKIFHSFTKENWDYLESMPYFIRIDNLVLIHAGITNKMILDETTKKRDLEKLLFIRELKDDNPLSLGHKEHNSYLWSDKYNGNNGIIVSGHNVFEEVKVDKYSFCIDTGCVFGGKLTATVFYNTINPKDNYEIVSQKAKKRYAKLCQNQIN